jgi:hypothetical protein
MDGQLIYTEWFVLVCFWFLLFVLVHFSCYISQHSPQPACVQSLHSLCPVSILALF